MLHILYRCVFAQLVCGSCSWVSQQPCLLPCRQWLAELHNGGRHSEIRPLVKYRTCGIAQTGVVTELVLRLQGRSTVDSTHLSTLTTENVRCFHKWTTCTVTTSLLIDCHLSTRNLVEFQIKVRAHVITASQSYYLLSVQLLVYEVQASVSFSQEFVV